MALQVTGDYATPIGTTVSSTYWRWTSLGVVVPSNTAITTLDGYVSAEAYAAGATPIGTKTYTLNGAAFGAFALAAATGSDLSDILSNAIYAYVQANDSFFAGATSV